MPPQDPEVALWFSTHLQPHKEALRRWINGLFPECVDVDDIIQESFVRVLNSKRNHEIESPKAYLFATARNLAMMQLRHRRVERIDHLAEDDVAGILDDGADVPAEVIHSQELELLTMAIQSLPKKCRQVITLRKIYGLSQKETAAKLGITEHTVEAQSTIGLHKLAKYFERYDPM